MNRKANSKKDRATGRVAATGCTSRGSGKCDDCQHECDAFEDMLVIAPHASQSLPDPVLRATYAPLNDTHFAVDIGTAELAAGLAASTGAMLFSGQVGRLGIDLNRSLETAYHADRPHAYPTVDDPAKRRSLAAQYADFHSSIAAHLLMAGSNTQPVYLIDVHSFNRTWRDQRRAVDIGVCDHKLNDAAKRLMTLLQDEFGATHSVQMDEPYPGTHPGAFIGRHYHTMGATTVTIEICNDLIATSDARADLLPGLSRALTRLKSEGIRNV